MDVKFLTVKTSNLGTVPIVDGQIVALADSNAFYYDMNSTRYKVSGSNFYNEGLPPKGRINEIYIIKEGDDKGVWIWDEDSSSYICVGNENLEDRFLRLIKDFESPKIYFTGLDARDDPQYDDTLRYSETAYLNAKTDTLYVTNVVGRASEAAEADRALQADLALEANHASAASIADRLGTVTVGADNKPIYLNAGTATACDFEVNTSVPEDAVFTDTTYDPFKGATETSDGEEGLVPAPLIADKELYLRGDGTWSVLEVPDMIGADTETGTPGVHGLVPAPTAGEENSFLKGDGTWTEYYAGPGIVKRDLTFGLAESGAQFGVYGPIPDDPEVPVVTGEEVLIPQITVDKYGRITKIVNITYKAPVGPSYPPAEPEHF